MNNHIVLKDSGIWAIVWVIFLGILIISDDLSNLAKAIDNQTTAIYKTHEKTN